jgi:hypothetical protein
MVSSTVLFYDDRSFPGNRVNVNVLRAQGALIGCIGLMRKSLQRETCAKPSIIDYPMVAVFSFVKPTEEKEKQKEG